MSQKFFSDITLSTLSSGILKVDADGKVVKAVAGTDYVDTATTGSLNGLSDVVVTSPTADQILVYGQPVGGDPGVNIWYNKTPSFLTGASSIGALGDVTIGTTSIGQLLAWNGNAWVNWSPNFLTSYTETDPIYTASSWYTTINNSSNWDTAYGWGNHAGLYSLTSHTHNVFTQATFEAVGDEEVIVPGSNGFVPASGFDDTGKFLRADGTWQTVTTDLTGYATETWVGQQGYLTSLPSHNHDDRYYTETESDNRFVSYESVSRTVPASGGWYKLAKIARGGARIAISYTGGSNSPHTFVIDAYKNWSSDASIKVEKYGQANNITAVRIIQAPDGGDTDYYIEALFADLSSTEHQITCYYQELLGYTGLSEVFGVSSGLELLDTSSAEGDIPIEIVSVGGEGLYTQNGGFSGNLSVGGTISTTTGSSSNWDTAYGWGAHTGLYDLLGDADAVQDNLDNLAGSLGANAYTSYTDHSIQGYLTSSTDSQTLEWNQGEKLLTISNGNTVDLSQMASVADIEDAGFMTAESDTLATVTARGATTTGNIVINGEATIQNNGFLKLTAGASQISGFTVYNAALNGYLSNRITTGDHARGWGWEFTTNEANNDTGSVYFRVGYNGAVSYLNSGNFGIGTTAPGAKLDVVSSNSTVLTLQNTENDFGGNQQRIDFIGKWWSGAPSAMSFHARIAGEHAGGDGYHRGNLKFYTASDAVLVDAMTIAYNGKVGIGTASPSSNLHVNSAGGSGVVTQIKVSQADDGAGHPGADAILQSSGWGEAYMKLGGHQISAAGGDMNITSTSDLNIQTGGANTRMFITNTGNVGIGTTNPQGPLEVYKSNSGGLGGHIILNNNGLEVGNETAILFNDSGVGSASFVRAAISSTVEGAPYLGNIQFKTGLTTYGSLSTRMIITGAGNVGIGTTNPGYKLEVAGNAAFTGSRSVFYDTGGGNFQIKASSGGWAMGYFFQGSSGTSKGGWGALGGDDSLSYLWAGDAYNTPTMVVEGGQGNVGIGTTNPSTKLHVDGVITATGGTSTNWNTAYGWGNHADYGYLTAETDSQELEWNQAEKLLTISNGNTVDLSQMASVSDIEDAGFITAESDTLATVTGRGDTTNTAVNFGANGGAVNLTGLGSHMSFKDQDNIWNGYVGFDGNTGRLEFPGRNIRIVSGYNGTIELNTGASGYNTGRIHIPRGHLNVENSYINAGTYMSSPEFRLTNSSNNAYITGNSEWGVRMVNDNGYIQFGPANNSWSHIYSDKNFYFNQNLYVNGTQVVLNSGTWGINITGSAASATTATTATNLSGLGSIQSTSTGTSYTANYQVRENAGGGSNTNEIYAPQLAFHWSGVVASSIMMESSGRIAIRNNPGGSYENFAAAVITATGGNSTNWNTAYGWGDHASAGYQAASTAITTSNIGSQSVATSTQTYRGIIEDTRSGQRTPDDYDDYRACWEFTNQIPGLSGSSWWSLMTVQGWHNGYSAWQIIGPSEAGPENWYLRVGNNTTWGTARRIWHAGDFTSTNVSNWDTAYGWGDHATANYWSTSSPDPQIIAAGSVTFQYDVEVQGTFSETSARRYKENIVDLEPVTDKVYALRPVRYNKIGNDTQEIGLIAEEVAELFPEVVHYNDEGQPESLNYTRLSVLLLQTVKELSERIQKLENK